MTADDRTSTDNGSGRRRQRLDPQERERQIVEGAIRFFAEAGFEGQTRELAKRLGITQPLLYRYFPSKEHLIERVYQEVFMNWRPHWGDLITDRSRSLEDRLVQLYREYTDFIFHYESVRIFLYAGLDGGGLNRRYLATVRERLLEPVCTELRVAFELPRVEEVPLMEEEIQLAVTLHGGIFYQGIRRWIYDLPLPADLDAHITRVVRMFVHGAPVALAELFTDEPKPAID